MVKTFLRDVKGRFISNKTQHPTAQQPITQTPKTIKPTTQQRNAKGQFTKQTPTPQQPIAQQPIAQTPKSSVSTSKTQQTKQNIQSKNGHIQVFNRNFTFDFHPKIDSKAFGFKIPYLIRRIISNYRNYNFNINTIVNIKTGTIMIDSKGNRVNIGNNTSNHKCRNFATFEVLCELIFKLIKNSAYSSRFDIEFIDLMVTIYQF